MYHLIRPYKFILTQTIREHVVAFEKKTRVMTSTLDKVHSTPKSDSEGHVADL